MAGLDRGIHASAAGTYVDDRQITPGFDGDGPCKRSAARL